MNMKLSESKGTVGFSREAMADLDIFRLCRSFFPARYQTDDEGDIAHFLHQYLTCDAGEIQRRSEIIEGLRANNEHKTHIISLLSEWMRLSHSLSHIDSSLSPFAAYTHMRHALCAYTDSIAHMECLFTPDASPAMAAIAEVIRAEKDSSFYKGVRESLHSIESMIQPLNSVTLVVNMTETGKATDIGITDINQNGERITGIIGGDGEGSVNSLFEAVPVTLQIKVDYLEEYIIGHVEKQMAAQLKTALRTLKKVDFHRLNEWQDWLEPIELYYTGLRLSEMLQEAGCIPIRPDPNADTIEAVDMLYPHMVLSKDLPVPQTIRLRLGDNVMITGANNSGKTSCLKSFAQNCILAQLGFYVPAQSFRFIPFKQWSTVFSAGEDEHMRASRYQQEALWMHEAIASADSRTCVLLNEPFTSTNPIEAIELLNDIITQFRKQEATLILVTHMFDLYHLLNQPGTRALRSYVTGSVHPYRLEEKEPDGFSQARLLARSYGLNIESLIPDRETAAIMEVFLAEGIQNA